MIKWPGYLCSKHQLAAGKCMGGGAAYAPAASRKDTPRPSVYALHIALAICVFCLSAAKKSATRRHWMRRGIERGVSTSRVQNPEAQQATALA